MQTASLMPIATSEGAYVCVCVCVDAVCIVWILRLFCSTRVLFMDVCVRVLGCVLWACQSHLTVAAAPCT